MLIKDIKKDKARFYKKDSVVFKRDFYDYEIPNAHLLDDYDKVSIRNYLVNNGFPRTSIKEDKNLVLYEIKDIL